jgi:hypothetical protein
MCVTSTIRKTACLLGLLTLLAGECSLVRGENPSQPAEITDGASIQRAIDRHPGEIIYLPAGDYEISQPITISHDGSGLAGPGRIIQTNPDASALAVSNGVGVQLRDFTLTRPAGIEGNAPALSVSACRSIVIDGVQILDNRSPDAAFLLEHCANGRVTNCLVRNYTAITVNDRTENPLYGFAFRCLSGTGIDFRSCQGMLVQGNRVEEQINLPTREIKEKFGLGKFTKKNATKGSFTSQETWDTESFPTWDQGTAIQVADPEVSDRIQLVGNYIDNASQAIDIHGDHVIVANNMVSNSALGVKAMHGSRNIIITGNQFDKCSVHAILLQPGNLSHTAGEPWQEGVDPAASPANNDGGSIIADNIISDFGYGDAGWVWGTERDCICLEPGQRPENPRLTDVIVTGNIVYDPGRDKILVDGKAAVAPPRYRYALLIAGAVNVKVSNNILHPGSAGVSNVPLPNESLVNPIPIQGVTSSTTTTR